MRSYLTPPPQHHLILASQSPRRKQLLVDAGISLHQIAAADIDETPDNAELPEPYALRMAQKKAEVIAGIHLASLFWLLIQLWPVAGGYCRKLKPLNRRRPVLIFCLAGHTGFMAGFVYVCQTGRCAPVCLSAR